MIFILQIKNRYSSISEIKISGDNEVKNIGTGLQRRGFYEANLYQTAGLSSCR